MLHNVGALWIANDWALFIPATLTILCALSVLVMVTTMMWLLN